MVAQKHASMHGYILWIPSHMPHCLQEKLAKVARMQAAVEEAEKSSTATSSPPSAVAVPGWICHHAHACPWHACMHIHAKACTCMCTHSFFGSITKNIYAYDCICASFQVNACRSVFQCLCNWCSCAWVFLVMAL